MSSGPAHRDPSHRDLELRVAEHPAVDAAAWLAERLREAVAERGSATMAVSGGGTAPPLFRALLDHELPWDRIEVWQVDERMVPDGHPERNAEQLVDLPATVHRMPVTDPDPGVAADRYAASLPETFDVVHLGLGDDGHAASWPPGDQAVVSSRRSVEAIGEFNGFRRMTLTPGVVNAARSRLMLTEGPSKATMMARWLSDDVSIPVSNVRRAGTVAFVDHDAAPWRA
jgi:6-phosphogluconolactonase/glucosamine-6-phosphate isomerase/deaminase